MHSTGPNDDLSYSRSGVTGRHVTAELVLMASCTKLLHHQELLRQDLGARAPSVDALISAASMVLRELGWSEDTPAGE